MCQHALLPPIPAALAGPALTSAAIGMVHACILHPEMAV